MTAAPSNDAESVLALRSTDMQRAGVAEDFDTGAPAAILSSMENMNARLLLFNLQGVSDDWRGIAKRSLPHFDNFLKKVVLRVQRGRGFRLRATRETEAGDCALCTRRRVTIWNCTVTQPAGSGRAPAARHDVHRRHALLAICTCSTGDGGRRG
jgi:hypothetical protein